MTATAAAAAQDNVSTLSPAAEATRKQIEAMIQSLQLTSPGLEKRLNVAIVYHYLQAPDACFGWIPKTEGDEAPPPMPFNLKMLCVAACIRLGFAPAMGHVLWMAKSAYVTADGLRLKANSDPDWVYVKAPKMRPLTQEEREMYDLEGNKNLMCGICEATVKWRGQEMEISGIGIIDKSQTFLPGRKTAKDRVMTLRTFAERDMLRRHYPVEVPVYDPDVTEDVQVIDVPQLTPASQAVVAEQKAAELESARTALRRVYEANMAAGISAADQEGYVGCNIHALIASQDADKMVQVMEALQDMPRPEPTPPSGKPADDQRTTSETPAAPASDGYPLAAGETVQTAKARLEQATLEVVKVGGAPMKILGQNPHNLVERAKVEELAAAADTLQAWLNQKAVNDRMAGAAKVAAAEEAAKAEKKPRAKAKEKPATAGAPVTYEPLPGERAVFVPDEEKAAHEAVAQPVTSAPIQKDLQEAQTATPIAEPTPVAPVTPAEGEKAYQMIDKLLANAETQSHILVEAALHSLRSRRLRAGDHVDIAKAFRLGTNGDMSGFNELERAREPLPKA